MTRGRIGDLVRAIRALRPDEATQERIAQLLGLSTEGPGDVKVVAKVTASDSVKAPTTAPKPATDATPETTVTNRPTVPSNFVLEATSSGAPPEWFPRAAPLDREGAPARRVETWFEPLFRREWTRAIVCAATATFEESGPIDVDEVIEETIRVRPLHRIPRSLAPTSARGIQLLIDHSMSMEPFALDQTAFTREVIRTLGRDGTQRQRFAGSPLRGVSSGSLGSWSAYRPPPAGTPVLAMTDLGIGSPPEDREATGPEEWLDLVADLRRAGCPFVAIVPYPPSRWPRQLVGRIRIVSWDRSTGTSAIRRIIGAGSRLA